MTGNVRLIKTLALCLLFALAYYGSALASVRLARIPEANWTVIWFSSGVGLLCVRALGRAGIASIAAAALGTSFIYYRLRAGLPWPTALPAAATTAALDLLQVWLAARADRRYGVWEPGADEQPYGRLAAYLLMVCAVPPLVTCPLLIVKDPLLGIGSISPDGTLSAVLLKIFMVATGNALGLFLLAPLAVVWKRWRGVAARGRELAALLVLVPLPVLLSAETMPHLAILAFAVALVVAVRHGLPGSVLAVLLLTLTTVSTVIAQAGPFPVDHAGLTVFGFALVIVVLGLTFHFVGHAVDELAHQRSVLEDLVALRTGALEAKSAELAAVAERKALFLAWLSHEVRTPMNAVLGMVRLMRRDGPGKSWDGRLAIAEGAGRHLVHLLDDVLELSRLEADPVTLRPEPADLRALVEEVAAILQPEATAKGLELSVRIAGGVHPAYRLDPLRVRQVLFNLIANAVKFTPSGAVIVRLRADPAGDGRHRIVLEVEDTGPGVPPDQRSVIFDAYVRADAGGRAGGAGLGLAIARGIAERMEGTLAVVDGTAGGALFRLGFPAWPAAPSAAPAAPSSRRALPPIPAMDILLVEDGPENRLVVMEWLAPGGHRIACAASGEEAVRAVAERPFDLILMDIRLDGMDGVEATRRIRALPDEAAALTPVIALTANASPRDRDDYAAAGIDEVLTKPLSPEALADALARHAPAGVPAGAPPGAPLEAASLPTDRPAHLDRVFLAALRELDGALVAAHAADDRAGVVRIAHRLHGSAATYGRTVLAEAAAALEAALRAAEDGRADLPADRLGTLVGAVRRALADAVSAEDRPSGSGGSTAIDPTE